MKEGGSYFIHLLGQSLRASKPREREVETLERELGSEVHLSADKSFPESEVRMGRAETWFRL